MRTWVVFDADGYRWCEEPGFHYSISGTEFVGKLTPDPKKDALFNHGFFPIPGLEWISPVPRQFNPEWYRDDRLDQHVLTKALWTFATGVQAAEFELTKKADGSTYPKNKFTHITRIPAGTASLDATNYTTLQAAAGVTLPAGMLTVAHASNTPVGSDLTTAGHAYTPMLQWSSQPAPDDVLVFGWSKYAMVLAGDAIILCGTPNGDRLTWERLAVWTGNPSHAGYDIPDWQASAGGLAGAGPWAGVRLRMFKTMIAGFNHLAFFLGQGSPKLFQRNADKPSEVTPFPAEHWWIGAAPGQHFWYQAQVMGYESASTTFAVAAGTPLILWDLGPYYKPSVPYFRAASVLVHTTIPNDIVTDDTAGIVTYSSVATGNELAFSVTDENGNVLAADGTHQKGGFSLSMVPSTPGGLAGAYLPVQLERLALRFPVKQVDRSNTPVEISDADFKGWRAEVSLREPTGKSFSVDLKETGADLFYAAGLHRRGNYPVEVWEDTDGDNVPDTVRVRAWVHKPRVEHLLIRDDAGLDFVAVTRVHAEGLLSRVDRVPSYLPQLLDVAANGRVRHTFAAEEGLLQSGFDPAVDAFIHIANDPLTGTNWELLPDAGASAPVAGKKTGATWAPTWDETWLKFIERIANQLVGWVIYENLTDIWYHPDLTFGLVDGGIFVSSATLYRSQANAVAAGVSGRQAYLPHGETEIEEPRGNRVRAISKDHDTQLTPWKLDTYWPAITGTAATDENFTGEPLPLELTLEAAPDEETVVRSARVYLLQNYRRLFLPSVELERLAPWQIAGPGVVDVGYIAQFEAHPHHNLIAHAEVEQVTSRPGTSHYRTRLVGEKTSENGTLGSVAGPYPGVATG